MSTLNNLREIALTMRRAEPQVRDVFDLRILGPRPDLPAVDRALRETAHARLLELGFADFRSQVVPTLASSAAEHYDDESVWDMTI